MIDEENKKRIISFTNGLSIASLVLVILSYVLIGVLVLCMIIIPFFTKNISIEGNTLSVYEEKIEFNLTKEEVLTIKYNDETTGLTLKDLGINTITKYFQNLSSSKITFFIEMICTFSIVELIITIIIFSKVRKLTKEMVEKKTPFIKEAPDTIVNIAYIIIALLAFDLISLFIVSIIARIEISLSLNLTAIAFIVFLFTLSFIFKYGYELENKGE